MKKHTILPYLTGILLAAIAVSGGCSKKTTEESDTPGTSDAPVITFQTDISPVFAAESDGTVITFTATADWTADVDQSWGSVIPDRGTAGECKVSLLVDANDSEGERNATLYVRSGSTVASLVFYQKQKDALTVTSNRFEVEQAGRDITVEVVANVDFDYEIEEPADEWLIPVESRAMQTTQLHFTVKPNESVNSRIGTIVIRSGSLKETVTVYQEGEEPQIVLTEENPVVGSDGGTLTVELRSNVAYNMELPDQPDWLRETSTRSLSTYTHRFEVDPNEGYDNRSTRIVFTDTKAGTSHTVTVTQMQRNAILISEGEYTLEPTAQTLTFKINTNVASEDLEIDISETWIRKSLTTRGLAERSLSFAVDANTDDDPREAVIRLSADGVAEQSIRIRQTGHGGMDILRITHTKTTFDLPTFISSSGLLYGTVSWGDNSQEEYEEGLSHTYRTGSTYTVSIELTGAASFTLPDLVGITKLDLTQF